MESKEFETEEARAIFYVGLGALVTAISEMLGISITWRISGAFLLIAGAYIVDSLNKKIPVFDKIEK